MNRKSKPFIELPSTKFGLSYFFIAIIYAIFFYVLPAEQWNDCNSIKSICDALYYSIITITTFGFGTTYPVGILAKTLTCSEVFLGLVFIGFYINSMSEEHADMINKESEARQKKFEQETALSLLLQHVSIVIPCIQSFLFECFELVTPIEKRKFPEDVFNHKFEWSFNDLHQLYEPSYLMTNPIDEPVVKCYFRAEHKLVDELRYLLSNSDLKFTPELRQDVLDIINECNRFAYEHSIIGVLHTTLGSGESKRMAKDLFKDTIATYKDEIQFRPSNFLNQFVALYMHLRVMIPLSQNVVKEMKKTFPNVEF